MNSYIRRPQPPNRHPYSYIMIPSMPQLNQRLSLLCVTYFLPRLWLCCCLVQWASRRPVRADRTKLWWVWHGITGAWCTPNIHDTPPCEIQWQSPLGLFLLFFPLKFLFSKSIWINAWPLLPLWSFSAACYCTPDRLSSSINDFISSSFKLPIKMQFCPILYCWVCFLSPTATDLAM